MVEGTGLYKCRYVRPDVRNDSQRIDAPWYKERMDDILVISVEEKEAFTSRTTPVERL